MMRFFQGLAMLMAAVLILTGISAAFAEEENIYTLPVDMSGGMPYQDSSFNKENANVKGTGVKSYNIMEAK